MPIRILAQGYYITVFGAIARGFSVTECLQSAGVDSARRGVAWIFKCVAPCGETVCRPEPLRLQYDSTGGLHCMTTLYDPIVMVPDGQVGAYRR